MNRRPARPLCLLLAFGLSCVAAPEVVTPGGIAGGKADDGRVLAEGEACPFGYHTEADGDCGPGLRCRQRDPGGDPWSPAGVCVRDSSRDVPADCAPAPADVPSDDLASALATVRADGLVTEAEWSDVLAPLARRLAGPSADGRALVRLMTDPAVAIDPGARARMRALVRAQAGYPVEAEPVTGPDAEDAAVRGNVSEPDRPLACLVERVAAASGVTPATVTIAVLDSGFDETHPELAGKLWTDPDEQLHGWNFQDGNADLRGGSHGTHVSGLATTGSDRTQVMMLRVSGAILSSRDPSHVAEAIDYAAAHGARVVSMSRGITGAEIDDVAAALRRHPELLVTAAAGNSGDELAPGRYDQYPLAALGLPNVIVVAASDAAGKKADYSCYGATLVDVASRGDRVSTVPVDGDERYDTKEGTSQATPAVASVAARCLLVGAALTPAQVKRALLLTAHPDADWTPLARAGVVRGDLAVRLCALAALTDTGAEAAADALALDGDERVRMLDLLARLDAP